MPLRKRGREGRYASGDADGYRQHVVDQKRPGRDKGWRLTNVVVRDDVGAATAWVSVDRLPVGEDDNGQNRCDDKSDRRRDSEGADPHEDKHPQDLFRRVRDGRQRVRGEDSQSGDTGKPLVVGEM